MLGFAGTSAILGESMHAAQSSVVPVSRLVCPFAVFDFTRKGLRVREIAQGLTAADLQAQLDALPDGPERTALADLARFCVDRDF